jgi:hypothetical protein
MEDATGLASILMDFPSRVLMVNLAPSMALIVPYTSTVGAPAIPRRIVGMLAGPQPLSPA